MKYNKEEINKLEKRISPKYFFRVKIIILRFLLSLISIASISVSCIIRFIISSVVLILCAFPLFIILFLRKLITGKDIFVSKEITGRNGRNVCLKYFNFKHYILRNISLFYYVIINRLKITGVTIKKTGDRNLGDSVFFDNNPGIFNLWYVRDSSKIAHDGKFKTEWEYVFKRNFFSDLMLILRSVPAFLYHEEVKEYSDKLNLFDLEIENMTMKQAVDLISYKLENNIRAKIYFVNPDCLNKIFGDHDYYDVLTRSDNIFPDGIGIKIAGKILKTPLKENVNGTDMLPFLCKSCIKNNKSIFLLGGKPGVAEKMKMALQIKYKGLKIAGTYHGYFDKVNENQNILKIINDSKSDILLVAFGAPYQEKWIDSNFLELNPSILMGVGGLFDFYSGNIKRAPSWIREIGLEWLYRFSREPKRMWRRYFVGNPVFIYKVLKFKFRKRIRT